MYSTRWTCFKGKLGTPCLASAQTFHLRYVHVPRYFFEVLSALLFSTVAGSARASLRNSGSSRLLSNGHMPAYLINSNTGMSQPPRVRGMTIPTSNLSTEDRKLQHVPSHRGRESPAAKADNYTHITTTENTHAAPLHARLTKD